MLKIAIVLLCVVALDRLIPKRGAWQPANWLKWYSNLILKLANPGLSANAPHRHLVKGVVAWIFQISLVAPLLLVPFFIPDQSGVSDLFSLYIALDISARRARLRQIRNSIQENKTEAAITLGKEWLTRDVTPQSNYELVRTILEHYIINTFRSVLVVVFWYIILGGPGAWLYWLSLSLDQACARKGKSLVYFRVPVQKFCEYAEWLPARLFALTTLITTHPNNTWRCWRTQTWSRNTPPENLVLSIVGGRLRLMLGGPGIPSANSTTRPYLGEGNPVTSRDLGRVDGLLNLCLWRWILTLAFFAWVIYQPLDLESSL